MRSESDDDPQCSAGRVGSGPPWPPWARRLRLTTAIVLIVVISSLEVLTAGLPDPAMLRSLGFAQPTIVYDRAGKVELGRFQAERRRVVAFDDVPRLVLDATTTAEDRTFWDNAGIDVAAIVAAMGEMAAGEGQRGASTITQQLVRARLLPEDVVLGPDQYLRKAKEILQSLRLSDEFPGEAGKQRVITGLPERDLLWPQRLWHRGGRRDLLRRSRPVQADGRPRQPCWPDSPSHRPISIRSGTPRRTRRVSSSSRKGRRPWSGGTGSCAAS